MSGIERGAKLPSLSTLWRVAGSLKVSLKDLLNFDQVSLRRTQPLSREGVDIAYLLQDISPQKRKQILKVVKILAEADE
jgi:transcriptional regulator with XRE-family HTH domain